MPPSGPPPAKATPILAAFRGASLPRRTLPSRMFLLTGYWQKPLDRSDPGALRVQPSVLDQRFDVALVARFTRLPTLRAAFAVDLSASFAWRCAGAFAASGKNFGSD